jgi:hypothetical protein
MIEFNYNRADILSISHKIVSTIESSVIHQKNCSLFHLLCHIDSLTFLIK